jgi:hypothetical protein
MKNLFFLLAVSAAPLLLFRNDSHAQDQQRQYAFADGQTGSAYALSDPTPGTNLHPAPVKNVKVYRNFKKAFPSIDNEKWRENNGYLYATFQSNGIVNKLAYTASGRLDYALKSYGEKQLPSTIRSAIKSVYYDFAITHVQELTIGRNTVYLVTLRDDATLRTIRYSDQGMEEIQLLQNGE